MFKPCSQYFFKPVSVASLAVFRVLFGLVMLFEVCGYYPVAGYLYPAHHLSFSLPPFDFIKPWGEPGMQIHFIIMGLAALGIALGFYYRISATMFFLCVSYIFILEPVDHFYAVVLFSFLMIFIDAHHRFSWDARRTRPRLQHQVPFWQLMILRFQVFVIYFYAGLAKINHDWLNGEPIRTWLSQVSGYPWIGPYLQQEWVVHFFAYGGLIFDLSIFFLLLSRKTLMFAVIAVITFHTLNNWLFHIAIFPLLMTTVLVLFLEPDFPSRLFSNEEGGNSSGQEPPKQSEPSSVPQLNPQRKTVILACLGMYCLFQLLFPLRHWLYPGNASWTEEGQFFSWRVKLRQKRFAHIYFLVTDPKTGKTWKIDPKNDLTERQLGRMASIPRMVLTYAHFLRDKFKANGITDPIVQVDVPVSLNGRPFQPLVDPAVNLSNVEYPLFTHAKWITELRQ